MSSTSSWENVWGNVQPSLNTLKDHLSSIYTPNPRVMRVGQLDSELLDQELVQLLRDPVAKSLEAIHMLWAKRLDPELTLLIQIALYKFSIWNAGASYGAKLQGLRYITPSRPNEILTSSGIPRRILLVHGTLTILVPYLYSRARSYGLSHAWPDAPTSDRRRKAWSLLGSLESVYTAAGLASFLAFLWNGHYRSIADRILNMRLVPARRLLHRDVSYEFMNRQMVWHAFTEFLLFFLPLINARKVQRRINQATASVYSFLKPQQSNDPSKHKRRGKYWSFPENQCAICAERASFSLNPTDPSNVFTNITQYVLPTVEGSEGSDMEVPAYPIYNPYVTSCGHTYCYHCIAERMLRMAEEGDEEQGWECLRCSQPVTDASRGPTAEPSGSDWGGSEYEFSSDLDVTDASLSGSIGSMSYSESGFSDDD